MANPSPATITDSAHHRHPLVHRKGPKRYTCDRCDCAGFDRRYRCKECKVSLHEICATGAETLDFFFMHPDHSLMLDKSRNPFSHHPCKVCGEKIHGYHYRCKPCGFDVHPVCSMLKPDLVDDAHPGHTLSFINGVAVGCSVCGDEIEWGGWRYCCEECNVHVHMRCLGISKEEEEKKKVNEEEEGDGKSKHHEGLKVAAAVGLGVMKIVLAALGEEGEEISWGEDEEEDDDEEEEEEEESSDEEEEEEEEGGGGGGEVQKEEEKNKEEDKEHKKSKFFKFFKKDGKKKKDKKIMRTH